MTIFKVTLAVFLAASTSVAVAAPGKTSCATSLSACPARGCEKADTPGALANIAKRNSNPQGSLKTLTFTDFETLQSDVEKAFNGKYATLLKPDRVRLQHMNSGNLTVGEGDLVQTIGFIAVLPGNSQPHANASGETVNCKLTGADNNDFHINITQHPGGTELGGIVVEMIPQSRNPKWIVSQLVAVQRAGKAVRVRGQLFFDNHHRVNNDPNHVLSNQPKRMSLWEIHPITSFEVCTSNSCDASSNGWTPLETWTGGSQP